MSSGIENRSIENRGTNLADRPPERPRLSPVEEDDLKEEVPGRTGQSPDYSMVIHLGILGLGVTLVSLWISASPLGKAEPLPYLGWITLLFLAGFGFRAARRAMLFKGDLTLHQAFSFEVLFQGSVQINPQLPYPSVEREFLLRESGSDSPTLESWFAIRSTSALIIPATLTTMVLFLGGMWPHGSILLALTLIGLFSDAHRKAAGPGLRGKFMAAACFGLTAAVLEGLAFSGLAMAVVPGCPLWHAFLLHGVLLTAFEFSPVPFALGILELAYGVMWLIPGLILPGLALVMAYRLVRAVPVLAGTLFYLSRYKMAVGDLFDPRLASALAMTRRPVGGWKRKAAGERPLLSIVIPAYNEEERLPGYLPGVVLFARSLEGGAEVLVVDDGSKDGTPEYVQQMASEHPEVQFVSMGKNQGKGATVRRGVLEAAGEFILFADADGATPISETPKLLAAGASGAEVVIASRKAGSGDTRTDRSLARDFMGMVFYRLTNLLAVPGVQDTQCGFKLFHRTAARRLFPRLKETGWAFDVEVLFLAQKFGMAIVEVPVNWTAVEGSKVNPIRDAVKMFLAILRIRRKNAGLMDLVSESEGNRP